MPKMSPTLSHVIFVLYALSQNTLALKNLTDFIEHKIINAENEWEWLERAPVIRMLKEDSKRIRRITKSEARRLLNELPQRLSDMAGFALATGFRMSNITGFKWSEVDLVRKHAWIHSDETKTEKVIPVPLNSDALIIIRRQAGLHPNFVFTYKDHSVSRCNTKAWKKVLKRSKIEDFRWHDLRHTWASWHV